MEEVHRAGPGGKCGASMPSQESLVPSTLLVPPRGHHPRGSHNPENLLNFVETHYTGLIDETTGHSDRTQSPAPFPIHRSGAGTGSSNPLITRWTFLARSPQQYLLPKVALLIQTQVPLSLHHLGNYKGFQSSMSEKGMKTKCVFLIINQKALIVSEDPPGFTIVAPFYLKRIRHGFRSQISI